MNRIVFLLFFTFAPLIILANNKDNNNEFNLFTGLIAFYSNHLSPLDGARSPSFPTGSAYGLNAFKEKGVLLGFILTADRLVHEIENRKNVHYKHNRVYDPLDFNTFWWDESVIQQQYNKVCDLIDNQTACSK